MVTLNISGRPHLPQLHARRRVPTQQSIYKRGATLWGAPQPIYKRVTWLTRPSRGFFSSCYDNPALYNLVADHVLSGHTQDDVVPKKTKSLTVYVSNPENGSLYV
jgi:hypothetical protein